jgi:hypothetical protein
VHAALKWRDFCDSGQKRHTVYYTRITPPKHAKQDEQKAKRQKEATEHEKEET